MGLVNIEETTPFFSDNFGFHYIYTDMHDACVFFLVITWVESNLPY